MIDQKKALAYAKTKLENKQNKMVLLHEEVFSKAFKSDLLFYKEIIRRSAINTRNNIVFGVNFGVDVKISKTFYHLFAETTYNFVQYLSDKNLNGIFDPEVNGHQKYFKLCLDKNQFNIEYFLICFKEFLEKIEEVEKFIRPVFRITKNDIHFDIFKNGVVLRNGEAVLLEEANKYEEFLKETSFSQRIKILKVLAEDIGTL